LGRFREAREPAARALAIFERETGPNSGLIPYPLVTIGVSHLGTNEPALAIPLLERAAHIRETNETPPAMLGEAHFALGRALADAGADLSHARELVERARREYEQAPRTPLVEKDLGDIQRWLVEHP
jgi:hypothetical protein